MNAQIITKTKDWEKEFLETVILPKYQEIGEYCNENNLSEIRDRINSLIVSSYRFGRSEIQAYRDLIQTVKDNRVTFNDKVIRRILLPKLPF